MKIDISIDPQWLTSGNGQHAGFISRLLRETRSRWGNEIGTVDYSAFDCCFEYSGNDAVTAFAKQLNELISSVANTSFDTSLFHVTIADRDKKYTLNADGSVKTDSPGNDLFAQINALRNAGEKEHGAGNNGRGEQAAPAAEKPAVNPADKAAAGQEPYVPQRPEKETDAETAPETEEKEFAFDAIQNLVGSGDFKKLARDIRHIAPQIIKNRTWKIFFSQIYLFSVDAGSGCHSSLKLLNGLLKETGLFTDASKPEMLSIPSFNDPEMAGKMKNAVSALENALGKQRLLSIDISEWIGHTHTREFRNLAMQLFRANEKCAVVLRIPYVRNAVIESTVKDISDVVSVRPVVFEPFTGEELREIARRYLDENGFAFPEKAWGMFDRQIELEKADGYFYGVHTVRKLVGDIIRKNELFTAETGDGDRIITDEVAASFEVQEEKTTTSNLDTLNSMIGMQEITRKVIEVVNQIVYSRKTAMGSKPTMHMCFVGNPGTGKTTVARIIGNVLKERGILRIGKFYEHHGRDLCAEYVGHTAPKTRAICQEAYGSVLFIDEAYALATDGDRYNFGKEAIETLITEMENNSDDLIVIFAGYPDEIQKMISLNPGMRSRIPYTIEFPNYTRGQLADIFMDMARKSFSCADDLEAAARKFFDGIPDDVLKDKTFGNGRYVRNIFERTWGKAIARSSENGFDDIVLNSQDFDEATGEYQYGNNAKPARKIGF